MTIDYIPGTTSNLVGDPAEGGAFSSGNKSELSGANTAAANAATSATAAAASEANAAASETAAATSESNAATSETNASASATTASQASASAQGYLGTISNLYDQFDDRYLGSKTSDPVLDNDGNALLEGALVWNSTSNELKVYNGSSWQLSAVDSSTILLKAQNLADLPSVSTARTNLGLGTMALETATDYAQLSGATFTGNVESPEFVGQLQGEVIFKAKAGEALSKGDAVYVSGISGSIPVVSKADADGAATYPSFGLADSTVGLNGNLNVLTLGQLKNIDTSMFNLGDTLYLSTTPGVLTNVPPAGEASKIQNVGKVEREHASTGTILVAGSGRTAVTPNLNDGNIFLGNASNKAVTADLGDSAASALSTKTIADLTITSADINGGTVDNTTIGATTPAAGTFTTANATTVDTTNIEVTNLKAKDGTSAGSIADSTGVVTLASSVLTTADIDGGTADNVVIGGSTAAAGTFTDLTVNDTVATVTLNDTNTANQTTILEESNGIFTIITRNGSSPGAFDVKTTDDGSTLTRRFRVASDGDANLYATNGSTVGFKWDASAESVGIGTTAPSEKLHVVGNQVTSGTVRADGGMYIGGSSSNNLMDEYEEGTFTVEVADASSGGNTATLGAGTQAYYTKIGRVVTINLRIVNINTSGMTSGNQVFIRGLPFNTRSSHVPAQLMYTVQVNKGSNIDAAVVGSGNSSVLPVRFVAGNGGTSACTVGDLTSGSAQLIFAIQYITP